MTIRRVVVIVVIAWLLLGAVALVFFNRGDIVPGDGRGETIEQSSAP